MAGVRRKPLTKELRKQAWDKTTGLCWYCGVDVTADPNFYRNRPNIEHLVPVSQGGPDTIENLVLACFGCNMDKRGRNVQDYREAMGELWAMPFEEAAQQLNDFREFCGVPLYYYLRTTLLDIAAFCRRGNFRFYGEMLERSELLDYQI